MSATGQGGLTQISLTLAAAGAAGSKYTFTHNVGRALQIATVTTQEALAPSTVLQIVRFDAKTSIFRAPPPLSQSEWSLGHSSHKPETFG